MKIEIKNKEEEKFTPVKIEITFETLNEIASMIASLNIDGSGLKTRARNIGWLESDHVIGTDFALYMYLKELYLKKK